MEASIIFHFAGRGNGLQRLALIDFAQLLDPRWKAPLEQFEEPKAASTSIFHEIAHSAYNFVQGGEVFNNLVEEGPVYVDLTLQALLERSERLLYTL